jgi:hypothetical protein
MLENKSNILLFFFFFWGIIYMSVCEKINTFCRKVNYKFYMKILGGEIYTKVLVYNINIKNFGYIIILLYKQYI